MSSLPLFSLPAGRTQRDAGMDRAAARRAPVLRKARSIAVTVALSRTDRCATADDVYRHLTIAERRGLGNAAGSLFRGPRWTFTGRRTPSRRISNNAREIKIWKLQEEPHADCYP